MLFALAAEAFAADVEQDLEYTIALDGKPVGSRKVTVKWFTDDHGDVRRMIESFTEIDASLIGTQYVVKERMTAVCGRTAGSFQTYIDVNGDNKQIQARRGATAWSVIVNDNGHESTRDWSTGAIDLSTADVFDPETRVPLGGLTNVRMLTAETGDILEGPLAPLGPSTLTIGGTTVEVDGFAWTVEGVESRFFYSHNGYLVRYEMGVIGMKMSGTLSAPPPAGLDEAPVDAGGTGTTEVPL